MPPIKIDHVVSFSSEDPVHNASNILSTDSSKKWKCQTSGEKQAIVVLQLEKASQITAVDIGNEHSAYVEILVSRSGNNDEFKVLLMTSAFMTPLESRQSQNVNKVRMFTKDQLSKPECDEKWDRVKIVCTQPFNRHVQFGLSFVTLHSNVGNDSNSNSQGSIGKFTIRPESPDNLSIGSLFAKRKEFKQDEKPTAAAAIRDAATSSSLAAYGSPTCKPKLKNKDPNSTTKKKPKDDSDLDKPKNRNRDALFYTSDDEENNEKIDRIMKKKEEEDLKKKEKEEGEKNSKKRKNFWGQSNEESKKTKNDSPEKEKILKKNEAESGNKGKKRKNVWGDSDEESSKKNNDSVEENKKKREKSPSNTPSKRNDKKEKDTPKHTKTKEDATNNTKLKKTDTENKDNRRKTNDSFGETSKHNKSKVTKPFHELLSGVTLVISGIQNPDRGVLRTMALSMGAKYKPDWDSTCTHLICAFTNTPKFNQVRGKGKIVKRSWIESCHSQRKKLPWRRFALDKRDLNKDESEDEICELVDVPSTSNTQSAFQKNARVSDDDDCKEEGSDTEEKIARIIAKKKEEGRQKKNSPTKNKVKSPPKNIVDTSPNRTNKDETAPMQIPTDDDLTDEESLNKQTNYINDITDTGASTTKTPRNNQVASSSKTQIEKTISSDDDETDEESLTVPTHYNKDKTGNTNTRVQTLPTKPLTISPKVTKAAVTNISDDDETDEETLNIQRDNTESSERLSNSQKNVYAADTDDEVSLVSHFQDERSMNIFHGEKFYVDESFEPNTYKKLTKYITAYHGKNTDDLTGNIDIIITTKENSKILKKVNQRAKCIDQEWILQTHSKHKLIPIEDYLF